jgi:hypothetical protein
MSEVGLQSNSTSEQLAGFLARTIATQVIGAAAAQLIANPLMAVLNISDTSQQKFQEEVLAQLDRIRDQLKDVQASLNKISTAVDALQQSINAYAISAALAGYYKTANQIHSRYRFFVDGVAALANPQADHAKAAVDLYVRLSPPADATISDAMDDIHSFVVPNAGVQGLFDHILTGMRDAMTAWAQNGSNYSVPKLGEYEQYWIPSEGGSFSSRRMLTGSFDVARNYIANFAVPLMKHVLATEIKGLMLLTRAWAGGMHDLQVGDYVDNILGHVKLMKDFFTTRVVPAARDLAVTNLKTHSKRIVGETLKRAQWKQLPREATGPSRQLNPTPPFLIDDNWVMWEQFPDFGYHFIMGYPMPARDQEWKWGRAMAFAHKPWEGGVRPVYLLNWSGHNLGATTDLINQTWQFKPSVGDYYTILSPQEFVKRTDVVTFLSERIGEIGIEAGGQVGVKVDTFSDVAPTALSDMVKNLPAKRDELKP